MSECIVAGEGLFAYVRFVCRILSVWNAKKKTQNYISWWDLVVEVEEPWFFYFRQIIIKSTEEKNRNHFCHWEDTGETGESDTHYECIWTYAI